MLSVYVCIHVTLRSLHFVWFEPIWSLFQFPNGGNIKVVLGELCLVGPLGVLTDPLCKRCTERLKLASTSPLFFLFFPNNFSVKLCSICSPRLLCWCTFCVTFTLLTSPCPEQDLLWVLDALLIASKDLQQRLLLFSYKYTKILCLWFCFATCFWYFCITVLLCSFKYMQI